MAEVYARVNGFFNKDIFFVEVTIFTYCTNVCVCMSYIHVCLCASIFHIHLYVCVHISV